MARNIASGAPGLMSTAYPSRVGSTGTSTHSVPAGRMANVCVMGTPCWSRCPIWPDAAVRWRSRDCPHRSIRSEEHTSELQSRLHLVCRLLLEKKKKKIMTGGGLGHDVTVISCQCWYVASSVGSLESTYTGVGSQKLLSMTYNGCLQFMTTAHE